MLVNEHPHTSRRNILGLAGTLALGGMLNGRAAGQAPSAEKKPDAPASRTPVAANKRFKIAGDDLFLDNKRQDPEALRRAAKADLDGVIVDMGTRPGGKEFISKFSNPEVIEQFKKTSQETGVAIAGLGFFAFYAHVVPNISNIDDTLILWVDSMVKFGCKFGHMPLMTKDGTLAEPEHKEVYDRTVAMFKKVAPHAEKNGVILGMESNLDGDGYKKFLDLVGSPAVQAYYNVGVGLANGYNAYADLRALGKERVCGLHLEQGSVAMMPGDKPETFERRLGNGLINFPLLRYNLETMDWSGWMSIARSRFKGTTSGVPNMTANGAYLRTIFPD